MFVCQNFLLLQQGSATIFSCTGIIQPFGMCDSSMPNNVRTIGFMKDPVHISKVPLNI